MSCIAFSVILLIVHKNLKGVTGAGMIAAGSAMHKVSGHALIKNVVFGRAHHVHHLPSKMRQWILFTPHFHSAINIYKYIHIPPNQFIISWGKSD